MFSDSSLACQILRDAKLHICKIQQLQPDCCLPASHQGVASLENLQALSFLVSVHVICTECKTQEILGSLYQHKVTDANQTQIYHEANEAQAPGSVTFPGSVSCLGVLNCLGTQAATRNFSCKESFLVTSLGINRKKKRVYFLKCL